MQDDLIERLRTQADAMMFNDCLEPCTMREAANAGEVDNARIAALEADNARLMGLVSSYRLQIDQLHDRAKIKETPDA